MKKTIAFEEVAMFVLSVYVFAQLPFAWWLFPALLLLPDISMIGYAVNNKVGAASYNFFHHKALGGAVIIAGFYYALPVLQLCGVILFAHSCFDRIFGYGLKYSDGFHHTHLGNIGGQKKQ